MPNMINTNFKQQKMFIYAVLVAATLVVFWQVNQSDFIDFDDHVYVTQNSYVQSGLTLRGLRWAFGTTYAEFWHPLTWISLMFDYNLHGLNPGGYHLTNLILHILSTLLLFWLFNRMTGDIWKSALVAALFALHPLHVETVAWVSKRKDVLSTLFWMLTLCLYVYYTEKPAIKRYLLVLFSFVLALLSKPMVVTLPVIMILLDYWPLKRFEFQKGNQILWYFREKTSFFILSAVFSVITLYAHRTPFMIHYSLDSRLKNAVISFTSYLGKFFWPYNLAVFYPFSDQMSVYQVGTSALLIVIISVAAVMTAKRFPCFLFGWFWYAVTILPVIGIIQVSNRAMSDNYTYIPSIGIFVGLAWGIPLLFGSEENRKKILLPISITILAVFVFLTWQQCGYWRNNFELWNHTCLATKNNYLAYNNLASELAQRGKIPEAIDHYNKAIGMRPDMHLPYNGRGLAYHNLGQYHRAIDDYNHALRLKLDYAEAFYNRGNAYDELGQYQQAIHDYNEAIRLNPDYLEAYNNRGNTYFSIGNNEHGCRDAQKACILKNCRLLDFAQRKGLCR